jgi:uncharacterized membrane protein
MTAIVAPLALTAGLAEAVAAGAVLLASMRLPIHAVLLLGMVVVAGLRALGL